MRITAVGVFCISLAGVSFAGNSWAAIKYPTHVEAQSLGPALEVLAKEHGFQVLYRTEILSNVRAHALNGELSTDQALRQLLSGTGLTYRYLGSGDTVVVEDPGYPPLFELLRARSIKLLSVPRGNDGPDVKELERLFKSARPRLLFTNTTCQNPTGTTTTAAIAHRILELADRYGFGIVEDDLFAEFAPRSEATLAGLDQLSRVTRVSSLSKTIAPELRVGYVMAPRAVTESLARTKLASSLASSELMERIALSVLSDGHHRRHLERLRRRLSAAQVAATQALESRGVEFPYRPQGGMFLWGKLPSREAVGKLWYRALQSGVLLAPGELFRPDGQAAPAGDSMWRTATRRGCMNSSKRLRKEISL